MKRSARKHPGGRKPAPFERRRTEVFRVRLTVPEADALFRIATREGVAAAELLRAALAAQHGGVFVAPKLDAA